MHTGQGSRVLKTFSNELLDSKAKKNLAAVSSGAIMGSASEPGQVPGCLVWRLVQVPLWALRAGAPVRQVVVGSPGAQWVVLAFQDQE